MTHLEYNIWTMKFSVLTFNLDRTRGLPRLIDVIKTYKPDIVAVQEFEISPEVQSLIEEKGYKLAGQSSSFRHYIKKYGVALFYNPHKMSVEKVSQVSLRRGLFDVLLFHKIGHRSVTSAHFIINEQKVLIHNVHLTPYSTNNLRRKQIHQTFKSIKPNGHPTIVLGDFNYPYGRKLFEDIFTEYKFKEATNRILHTFRSTLRFFPFKFKLDYVLYSNIKHVKTTQIFKFTTDHTPIYSEFEI